MRRWYAVNATVEMLDLVLRERSNETVTVTVAAKDANEAQEAAEQLLLDKYDDSTFARVMRITFEVNDLGLVAGRRGDADA